MSIPFGFTCSHGEIIRRDDEIAVEPEITWDEVIGDGYVEGDEDEGYA
jgi:hypothetical protein